MPNRIINDRIASFVVRMGWFQSEDTHESLFSDNWRLVKDSEGREAILYVMFYHTESGEPNEIPNEPDAISKLASLYQNSPTFKFGPFIALAEISGVKNPTDRKAVGIMSIRVWNVSTKLSPDVSRWTIAEMGRAWHSFPRTVSGNSHIPEADKADAESGN